MADSTGGTNGGGSRSLVYALIGVVVALVIVAGVGWGMYATKVPSPTLSQEESQVTALAYEHWQAIGVENLSQTISQYTSSSVLYWNVKNSALNGTYTNLSQIESTWSKFFQHDPIDYYSIYNFKVSVSGSYANVTADLWYIVLVNSSDAQKISGLTSIKGNGSVNATVATLILPYLLTYKDTGGTWQLIGDWWGLPAPHNGFVVKGIVEQFLNLTLPSGSSPGSGGVGGY
ncbi:MAG TPA: hypothetical protein VKU79_06915 [Thermoplasmataceae archaeon]|nr:hypothetical protein [Thermoplasmatales archaeon AK]HLH86575.1 hypothetical protein [Thermoplasmataceae archaeon]